MNPGSSLCSINILNGMLQDEDFENSSYQLHALSYVKMKLNFDFYVSVLCRT